MNAAFVERLQAAAEVLSKFAEAPSTEALRWNGTAYSAGGVSQFDPHAAKWWGILTALAGVLCGQKAPLTPSQKDYLDRLLFGGMGSFNDFALDETLLGREAAQANHELVRLRKEMFEEFRVTNGVTERNKGDVVENFHFPSV